MAEALLAAATSPGVSPAPAVLTVEHASKRYDTLQGRVTAVDDVSFALCRGEFVSVIGPSGCGKSTLFGMVGGLVDVWQGRIVVDG